MDTRRTLDVSQWAVTLERATDMWRGIVLAHRFAMSKLLEGGLGPRAGSCSHVCVCTFLANGSKVNGYADYSRSPSSDTVCVRL